MWYRFAFTHVRAWFVVALCAALVASAHLADTAQAQAAQADVRVTIQDSPDPVTAGQGITYVVTVQNAGPDMAAAVKISYSLAGDATFTVASASASQGYCDAPVDTPECHLGDLASGGMATIQVIVQAHTAGTIYFDAESYTETDDADANNDYADETTAVQAGPPADVAVTIEDSADPVTLGQIVTYLVTVQNLGAGTATEVKISYSLSGDAWASVAAASASQGYCDAPADTLECHLGDLPSGGMATVEVAVTALSMGTILFDAESYTTADDAESNNDFADETTAVEAAPPADIAVTLQDSPDPAAVGQTVTYLATVQNAGPGTATELIISYAVSGDAQLTVDVAQPSQGACGAPGAVGECNLVELANGGVATVAVAVTVLSPGTIEFEVDSHTHSFDPVSGNSYATESTTVEDDPCPTCSALDDLLPTGNGGADGNITKAIDHLEKSLTAQGARAFDEEKKATKELTAAVSKVGDDDEAALRAAMGQIVESARTRARAAIDSVNCGASTRCQTGLGKANAELAKVDAELVKGKPDRAIDRCKAAWTLAQGAGGLVLPAAVSAGQQTLFLPLISAAGE